MNQLNRQKFMNMFNDMLNDRGNNNSQRQFVTETKGDEVDFATQQKEQVLHHRLDQRNVFFLRKVAQAKQKILDGTYGLCEDCGCDINQKRLLARPTATLCIDCQEEKERGESALIGKRRDLKDKKFEEMDPDSHLRAEPKFTKVKDIGFDSVVGDM
tara:strand:+ start:2827 stop:3297 length:471 start_codon:yes stop_codon:yes gene_type:complete